MASADSGGTTAAEVDHEPDAIFRAAGAFASARAAGRPLSVLDAGTGRSSLSWLLRSHWVGEWVAVTASALMETDVAKTLAAGPEPRPPGRIVRGVWEDDATLAGEVFDVVVADYLLGSVDGFTPYKQDVLFERLMRHVAADGCLIVVGLEPIPTSAPSPYDVVPLCARLRDAAFLHAGQRPYREYPLSWVLRSLAGCALEPALVRRFPIIYSANDLCKELHTARSRLAAIESRSGRPFALALAAHIDETEARTRATFAMQPGGRLTYGEDYLVCATRSDPRPAV